MSGASGNDGVCGGDGRIPVTVTTRVGAWDGLDCGLCMHRIVMILEMTVVHDSMLVVHVIVTGKG